MTESRLLFRQALIDATLELADDLRDRKTVSYSAKHKKRMRSMGVAIGLSTRAKILIALIAAAILLTGCAVFREHITGLLLSFGDGFVNIEGEVNPDAPKEIEHAYVATYIPEGFVEVEREEEWYQVKTVWQNAEGTQIKLIQGTLEGSVVSLDIEKNLYNKISYNDSEILAYKHSDVCYSYICSTNMYIFDLTVYGFLPDATILEIFDNLK